MRNDVVGGRRVTRLGMDHSVRRLPDITIPSAPAVLVACCGMVNDMLRLRSAHGKMGAKDGALTMNPQQAKKLGRHLKQAREAIGISARELARRADVPDSTIVRIEQGAFAEPSPEKLQRMAAVLGLNLADLYVMADYPIPELPTLTPYLRTKYGELPREATEQIQAYADRLARKHGVDLSGPSPGEDEQPESMVPKQRTTAARTKKGGTR